jgi:hypothetical protein
VGRLPGGDDRRADVGAVDADAVGDVLRRRNMRKLIAVLALLLAGSAFAVTPTARPLTGNVFDPSGAATITTGKVVVTPIGVLPGSVAVGQLVPVREVYPVVSGVLTCAVACSIVSPANYKVELYNTVAGVDSLVMTFNAGVAESAAAITFAELYASLSGTVTVAPGYALLGCDLASFSSGTATIGTVLTAGPTQGKVWWTNPAGTGTISGVTAGTGLTGGGTSGGVTLNLAATAVTPGTYGVATGYALGITVDQQGRITAASQRALGEADITSLVTDLSAKAPLASPTFTGIVSAPAWRIVVSPGAGSYWGTVLTAETAGETLAAKSVAYLSSDGTWYKAKADVAATSGPVLLGIVPVTITIGNTGVILIEGTVEATGWGLVKGTLYFVSPTVSGGLAVKTDISTNGWQIRAVGNALSTTSLYFHPSPDYGEHS